MIFDRIRKRWLLLTEEEWVRQNFVRVLTEQLHYPVALIALEKEIRVGELRKRFDILVYNQQHQPWMLVECKAPDIQPGEKAYYQVLRYHITLPATFLVITNGSSTQAWEKTNDTLQELTELPAWRM
ncbi:type I restriction enzyme HsdR N-terminal domain-containing protein [Nostoc ellipsosporum NOK]|nr:type I restriction enzyme HsdR N-terminal domain-containing protein [Nostoc ellipsosporum NOK]